MVVVVAHIHLQGKRDSGCGTQDLAGLLLEEGAAALAGNNNHPVPK